MSDLIELSKPYSTRDVAAMCGFRKVMMDSIEWHQKEFAFWVILKTKGKEYKYHYSSPKTQNSSTGVALTIPNGHFVRAFCHTHPKSTSSGDFGSDDFSEFKKVLKSYGNIVFYLMNPYQEIRLAENENDFLQGKSVAWLPVGSSI